MIDARVLLLAALVALSGCGHLAEPSTPSSGGPTDTERPADVLQGGFSPPLTVKGGCGHYNCFEPSAGFGPDGAVLIMEAYGGPLWTFNETGSPVEVGVVPPPPGLPPGAGNEMTGPPMGDAFLQNGPDGRLYYSALWGGFTTPGFYLLNGVQVAASSDGGKSWPQNVFVAAPDPGTALGPGSDRQWLAFGQGGGVYLTVTTIGTATRVSYSPDGGITWGRFALVETGQVETGRGPAGMGTVAPDGRFCLPRYGGDGPDMAGVGLYVYCSTDKAASFVGHRVASGTGALVPMVAATTDGVLHVVWTNRTVWISNSTDGGASWSAKTALALDTVPVNVWAVARGQHLLLHGYLSNDGKGGVRPWVAIVAPGTPMSVEVATTVVYGTNAGQTGPNSRVRWISSDFGSFAIGPNGQVTLALADLGNDLLIALPFTPRIVATEPESGSGA